MAAKPKPKTKKKKLTTARPKSSPRVLAAVLACFALSGFAALLYQTAWLRQFSLAFGTSELAVTAVLAAYMAGLAGGAFAAGRYLGRVREPLRVYGWLEAGIGVAALVVPWLLAGAGALYAVVLGGRPAPPDAASVGQPVFYVAAGFVVLAIPTALMGATLPLLARHVVTTDEEIGPRVAWLYAVNTAGAVLGTLAAAFVLLPSIGLQRTVWVGIAVNAAVYGIARWLAGTIPPSEAAPPVEAPLPGLDRARSAFAEQPFWMLPLILVSGAISFLYEVLWTRMLSPIVGGSLYSFATMLAAFLAGIALGGGLSSRVAKTRSGAGAAFAVSQAAIAALSIAIYAWVGPLVPDETAGKSRAFYAVAVMLPATVFVGATFPLAVRVLAPSERHTGAATARAYAWNTLGCIVGAIAAGFWIIPGLGFEGALKLAVCANLALALGTLAFVVPRRAAHVGVAAAALAGVALAYSPPRPEGVVRSTAFRMNGWNRPREVFYAVGRSATVTVFDVDGTHHVLTNGLPEATVAPRGSPPGRDAEKWLTALPVVARPEARSMLVIGLGGGVSLAGVPPSVSGVDVIELEPEVIRANRAIRDAREADPLADRRVTVVVNDARNALRLTTKKYDAIVSQPSHPWTSGASHLFTREFVESAKAHLEPHGVFVQWMNSEFVTAPLLKSLAATLLAEFENVRLYQPTSQVLIFLASELPLDLELELAASGRPLADAPAHYAGIGMHAAEDVVAALVLDTAATRAFAGDAPISTDDDNLMATRSRSAADGLTLDQLGPLLAPHDVLVAGGGWVHGSLAERVDLAYVARRVAQTGPRSRVEAFAAAIGAPAKRAMVAGQIHLARGDSARAADELRAAIGADPDDMQARYLLMRLLDQESSREERRAILEGTDGPAVAVMAASVRAGRRDWAAVAELDPMLARARVTDVFYAAAAELRASWRVHLAGDDRMQRAADAVSILDPVFSVSDEATLFGLHQLRAQAAAAAGQDDALVVSARELVVRIERRLRQARSGGKPAPPDEIAVMRQNVEAVARELERDMAPGARERAAEVKARAKSLLGELT